MELKKKQIEILEILKKGEQLEYEIAFQIHSSQRYTRFYLEDLEKNNLVEKKQEKGKGGKKTSWKLKNGI
jgi:predicted ArsR family transcriptional regulator